MRVISKTTLAKFWNIHPDSQNALLVWYRKTEKATWKSPQDIKSEYRDASFVSNNRIVFNICGNKYRLVVWCAYEFGRVFIRFVGTHKEYDKIDARKV